MSKITVAEIGEDTNRSVRRQGERARAQLAKFVADLNQSPQDAMERATTAFQAAAVVDVTGWYEAHVDRLDGAQPWLLWREMRDQLRAEALREVRWPSRSTSPSSNIAAQSQATARVELSEELDRAAWFAHGAAVDQAADAVEEAAARDGAGRSALILTGARDRIAADYHVSAEDVMTVLRARAEQAAQGAQKEAEEKAARAAKRAARKAEREDQGR